MRRDEDTPMPPRRTVVVVGGGYSGSSVAVQLLQGEAGAGLCVVLVERRPVCGRGLAYGQADDQLLLNAPAGNMSAFADRPEDFVDYCRAIDPALCGASFVPRRVYGDYLQQRLEQAQRQRPGQLRCVSADVIAVRPSSDGAGAAVCLHDGRELRADAVVLALGHALPRDPLPAPGLPVAPQVLRDPWDLVALDALPQDRPVLLIGTGHTAVDAAFRLVAQAPGRRVVLVSRHGLLPHGHRAQASRHGRKPGTMRALPPGPPRVRVLLRWIREAVQRRVQDGGDWHDLINALRPQLPQLWRGLELAERRRFLRHLLAYWDIHRHRLAPVARARLQSLLEAGRIEVMAARLQGCEAAGPMLRVRVRPRAEASERVLEVGAVVNCAGPRSAIDDPRSALVRQLKADGLLQRDALGLGVHVDDGYRLLDAAGQPVEGLHYVGPGLKADHWEAVAVPELRLHVQDLVAALQSRLGLAADPRAGQAAG